MERQKDDVCLVATENMKDVQNEFFWACWMPRELLEQVQQVVHEYFEKRNARIESEAAQ